MTAERDWLVVEFDAGQDPIWTTEPLTEDEAAERFDYVTRKRSQRGDVVIRARSAALVHRGKLVDARPVRRSRRAPLLGNKALTHVDIDVRERVVGLELLATRLAWASLRRDGTPRIGPAWGVARNIACDLLTLVRGSSSKGPDLGGWWMVEWDCLCTQVERSKGDLHDTCPYHDAPLAHGPHFAEA